MNVWYVMAAALVLCFGFSLILRRYGLRGLEYRRRFSSPAYFEGQEAEMIEVVRNDRPLLIPWLRVESRLPASMRFGHQEDLAIVGRMYHRSVFMLTPYQQITRRHRVRLTRRGAYDIGNATLTAGDPLGISQSSAEWSAEVRVLVYPRLLEEDELPAPFSRMLGECIVRHSLIRDPFLYSGLRAYRPGDSVRDIHWPASARTQETMVRTHDMTAQTRLMVLINGQLRDDQWDAVMDYDQPQLETAIAMAATLCIRMIRAGLSAGFAANMPQAEESRDSTMILPVSGTAMEETLLAAMARLRCMTTRKFTAFLEEELAGLRGMDLLVLSVYDSPSIRQSLAMMRANGNTTRLYVLDQGEVALDA